MAPLPFLLDSGHRGPLVNIGSWIMMVFMCFAVVSKAASKVWKVHTLRGDDILILAAMVRKHLSFSMNRSSIADLNHLRLPQSARLWRLLSRWLPGLGSIKKL